MRGVTVFCNPFPSSELFLLTRLMRGVTKWQDNSFSILWISTHTPHARRDDEPMARRKGLIGFLLTRLMRGVTWSIWKLYYRQRNFYSHASCEAWPSIRHTMCMGSYFYSHASCEAWQDGEHAKNTKDSNISTHTPHARRDLFILTNAIRFSNFYSHASCEAWLIMLF